MHDACDRAAIDDERRRDRPARIARNKGARAVDGINDKERASLETLRIVRRFLRQPSGLETPHGGALQERVGGKIGLRYRRPAGLGPNLGRRRRSEPEEPKRQRPGLARGGGQTVARGERAPIRVDVQTMFRGSSRDSRLGFSRPAAAMQSGRRRDHAHRTSTLSVFSPEDKERAHGASCRTAGGVLPLGRSLEANAPVNEVSAKVRSDASRPSRQPAARSAPRGHGGRPCPYQATPFFGDRRKSARRNHLNETAVRLVCLDRAARGPAGTRAPGADRLDRRG